MLLLILLLLCIEASNIEDVKQDFSNVPPLDGLSWTKYDIC